MPQYLLINNLKAPIRVRQVTNGAVTGNEISVDNAQENSENKREIHLHRATGAKKCCGKNKQSGSVIQFQAASEELESFEFPDSVAENEDQNERPDIDWSIGFNPNDAIDFQTE